MQNPLKQFVSQFSMALLLGSLAVPALAKPSAKTAALPLTWVELGESGAVIARQVILLGPAATAKTCPAIRIKGVNDPPTKLTPRGPAPSGFPVLVCEVVIPSGATSASINGVVLPLPAASPKKIVVIGDTGCKGDVTGTGKKVEPIEEPDEQEEEETAKPKQDCTPAGWPFHQVAKSAAASRPDLVIHVGDYVYVKPDSWQMWYDQFFKPAKKLLLSAPWIFVRGNHEICDSKFHGVGFFLLLDPRPYTGCPSDNTAPYLVSAGGAQFVVMDSSGASCDLSPQGPPSTSSCTQAEYDAQVTTWADLFRQAGNLLPSGGTAIMLSHRPVWGAKPVKNETPLPEGYCPEKTSTKNKKKKTGSSGKQRLLLSLNSTLQGGYQQAGGSWIRAVVAGHIHTFELITYEGGPAPQIVVGDSGVKLSHGPPKSLTDCKLWDGAGTLRLSTLNGLREWGYGVINPSVSKLHVYQPDGTSALKCDISATSASCK